MLPEGGSLFSAGGYYNAYVGWCRPAVPSPVSEHVPLPGNQVMNF